MIATLLGVLGRLKPLVVGRGRWVTLAILFCVAAAVGSHFLWRGVRDFVFAGPQYRINPRDIHITPPPEWIRSDIKAEVFRDASIDGALSILDDNLTENIAQAFSLHPWVAKVERVTKYHPAGLDVELVYRRPVAMVEVAGGVFPVDVEGTLLPTADFSPLEVRRYPRLSGVKTDPIGPVGTRWGDPRVLGGAQLADAFGAAWQELGLARIEVAVDAPDIAYDLVTRGGMRIAWGSAPAVAVPGETTAAEKVARLKKYAAEHNGGLDGAGGAQSLDVRRENGILVTPRTAIRQSGGQR